MCRVPFQMSTDDVPVRFRCVSSSLAVDEDHRHLLRAREGAAVARARDEREEGAGVDVHPHRAVGRRGEVVVAGSVGVPVDHPLDPARLGARAGTPPPPGRRPAARPPAAAGPAAAAAAARAPPPARGTTRSPAPAAAPAPARAGRPGRRRRGSRPAAGPTAAPGSTRAARRARGAAPRAASAGARCTRAPPTHSSQANTSSSGRRLLTSLSWSTSEAGAPWSRAWNTSPLISSAVTASPIAITSYASGAKRSTCSAGSSTSRRKRQPCVCSSHSWPWRARTPYSGLSTAAAKAVDLRQRRRAPPAGARESSTSPARGCR